MNERYKEKERGRKSGRGREREGGGITVLGMPSLHELPNMSSSSFADWIYTEP